MKSLELKGIVKQILKEFTSNSLIVNKPTISFDSFKKLKPYLPKSFKSATDALRRIKGYQGKRMFVHIQYFDVMAKDGKKFRFHQTQYWLSNEEVNVTSLSITNSDTDERYGDIYVDTKIFLSEVRDKFKILKKAS